MTTTFDDWKAKAQEADILGEAVARGAKLKRAGREHVGPCPVCGGTDRFSINIQKRIFNCRGAQGGDVIGMVMHVDGVSFTQACEALTGEPPPNGRSEPLTVEQKHARAKALADAKAREQADKAAQEAYEDDTKAAAQRIWNSAGPIAGTIAEKYLNSRGIPTADVARGIGVLRFHPALPYPKKPGSYPALICRVDDMGGELCAVWRIFLRADGRKADVPDAKLGLGPAGGGAVRIGNDGRKIGLAEGAESALGAWNLIGRKYPVWSTLSTSGLIGIELPLGVEHVVIFPDGDAPMRKKDGDYVPTVPAGRKAAETLRARLLAEGLAVTIAAEPSAGKDYADLWLEHQREVA
jgi:putative DNA primase/helicase